MYERLYYYSVVRCSVHFHNYVKLSEIDSEHCRSLMSNRYRKIRIFIRAHYVTARRVAATVDWNRKRCRHIRAFIRK